METPRGAERPLEKGQAGLEVCVTSRGGGPRGSTQAFRKRMLCPCRASMSPRPKEVGLGRQEEPGGAQQMETDAMSGACGDEAGSSRRAAGHHHELLACHCPALACRCAADAGHRGWVGPSHTAPADACPACWPTDPAVEVVSAMQDLAVEEGGPAELLCQYSRPVQATWKMDEQEVHADGHRVIIEQDWTVARLSFKPALPCDSGIYSCEAAGTRVVALLQVQGEAAW